MKTIRLNAFHVFPIILLVLVIYFWVFYVKNKQTGQAPEAAPRVEQRETDLSAPSQRRYMPGEEFEVETDRFQARVRVKDDREQPTGAPAPPERTRKGNRGE